MTRRRSAHLTYSLLGVLILAGLWPPPVRTQAALSATGVSQHHETTPAHKNEASGLVKVVRESTERFRDVSVAALDRRGGVLDYEGRGDPSGVFVVVTHTGPPPGTVRYTARSPGHGDQGRTPDEGVREERLLAARLA